jgi:hypothetical protein
MHRSLMAVAGLALVGTSLAVTPAVAADTAGDPPTVLARGQMGPLSLDVSPRGTVWYSQNFAGLLMRIRPGGEPRVVGEAAGELGGVSVKKGVVTYVTTSPAGRTKLMVRRPNGRTVALANLSRYERNKNPDAGQTYGVDDLPPSCEWPQDLGPATYTGIVESHPYATVTIGRARYVADAAANAILKVGPGGKVTTAAVLPPQPAEITAEGAEANGIPDCAVGHVYDFEAVSTDVERGRNGKLYVTLLPGGPEDPSLGARASVLRVDRSTGTSVVVAEGLLSATGVTVAPNGDLYVAQLFRNRISRIPAGEHQAVFWRKTALPGDVEFAAGRVWTTRKVLGAGQVVRFPR